jgi:hypothetical protein
MYICGMSNVAAASLENDRRNRHRRICEASRAALASAEFRQFLDELNARCEAVRLKPVLRPQTDVAFDSNMERAEGWAFEPIGNAFA